MTGHWRYKGDTSPILTDFTLQRRRRISKQTIASKKPEMLTGEEEKVEIR